MEKGTNELETHSSLYNSRKTPLPILIGGGVGPMAGVLFHKLIIEQTKPGTSDQDHLSVIHISQSNLVPDRTEFLLGRETRCPAEGMLKAIETVISDTSYCAVLGIPCNTFHAERIFSKFIQLLKTHFPNIQCIGLLQSVIEEIKNMYASFRTIGVLSTTGTQQTGLYKHALEDANLECVSPQGEEQDLVHQAIYNKTWGIKPLSHASAQAQKIINSAIQTLKSRGAEAIILGCTELPIAIEQHKEIPIINPLRSLARNLICTVAGEEKLVSG